MFRIVVWLALFDFLGFMAVFIAHGPEAGTPYGSILGGLYSLTAVIGLILAIYGFAMLVRGGQRWLKPSVLCILLTLVPACTALIDVLSKLGTHPV